MMPTKATPTRETRTTINFLLLRLEPFHLPGKDAAGLEETLVHGLEAEVVERLGVREVVEGLGVVAVLRLEPTHLPGKGAAGLEETVADELEADVVEGLGALEVVEGLAGEVVVQEGVEEEGLDDSFVFECAC